ncbi:MAG: hypothetical protein L6R42_010909, partial [Xanthoria sp. 1 TBL-2021]
PPGCHPDSHTRRSDPYILHGIEHRISPQHPMGLDEVALIVHVRKVPFWYLLPQKPTQGPPPLLDLVFQQSLLWRHAANVVVVLQVRVQWVYQTPANPGSSFARKGQEGQLKTWKRVLFMEASQGSGSRLLRMTTESG